MPPIVLDNSLHYSLRHPESLAQLTRAPMLQCFKNPDLHEWDVT